jgi:YD repeat-containing protein
MLRLKTINAAAGLALLLCAPLAAAHIGVVNTQLPFAREGTYELVLAVPHGCAVPGSSPAVETDTYRVEVTTPAAFGSPRAIIDGVFGVPTRSTNADGTTTFVWTKLGNGSSNHFDAVGQADNQSYRIALRGSFRATTTSAEGTRFTTQRFNAKQYCKNPAAGQPDLFTDWANYSAAGDNQSPAVKVYPTRVAGWNAYTLPASVAATLATPAAVSAFVKAYFGDAQIVWVGKAGYSPNADTTARIQALVAKDSSYSELVNKPSLSSSETLWVKY